MNGLIIAWFLSLAVLGFVGLTYLLRFLEQRIPAFQRWLDERFGEDSAW